MREKAILVVSFGTVIKESREKTIDAVEAEIQKAYPDYQIYRGWTGKQIIKKLEIQEKIHVDTVKEAMQRMAADGIKEVIVQPTHVINGVENNGMIADVLRWGSTFESLKIGVPLVTSWEDCQKVVSIVIKDFDDLREDEALVFIGHGRTNVALDIFHDLNQCFQSAGYNNVFLGSAEAELSVDMMIEKVQEYGAKKVIMMPFLLMAGEHARWHMMESGKRSWKSRFERAGFEVECVLKGLGEYEEVRRHYVQHIKEAR